MDNNKRVSSTPKDIVIVRQSSSEFVSQLTVPPATSFSSRSTGSRSTTPITFSQRVDLGLPLHGSTYGGRNGTAVETPLVHPPQNGNNGTAASITAAVPFNLQQQDPGLELGNAAAVPFNMEEQGSENNNDTINNNDDVDNENNNHNDNEDNNMVTNEDENNGGAEEEVIDEPVPDWLNMDLSDIYDALNPQQTKQKKRKQAS